MHRITHVIFVPICALQIFCCHILAHLAFIVGLLLLTFPEYHPLAALGWRPSCIRTHHREENAEQFAERGDGCHRQRAVVRLQLGRERT